MTAPWAVEPEELASVAARLLALAHDMVRLPGTAAPPAPREAGPGTSGAALERFHERVGETVRQVATAVGSVSDALAASARAYGEVEQSVAAACS